MKIIENFKNTIYWIYNYILIIIFNKKNGGFKIPKKYKLEFTDSFNKYTDENWYKRQYFGHINVAYHWQYFSEDNVEFSEDGLKLFQNYNPRTVEYWDGKTYNTKFDVGCLNSKKLFKYGLFEFDIELPKGCGLWPAVWLTGYESWPPEIDLIEAYSDIKGNWNNDLKTNAFYDMVDNVHDIKARKSIPIKNKNVYNTLNIKLLWEEDRIVYYYNNYKVREIKDKSILKWYKNINMYVVLNTAVRDGFYDIIDKEKESTFIVKKFNYFKIKD